MKKTISNSIEEIWYGANLALQSYFPWNFSSSEFGQHFEALNASSLNIDLVEGSHRFNWDYLYEAKPEGDIFQRWSAQAVLAEIRDQNTLVLSFRGTDSEDGGYFGDAIWDGQTFNANGASNYYESLKPLIDAAYRYIEDNDIEKFIVSGHSLGGTMADIFTVEDAWRFDLLPNLDFTVVSLASAGIPPALAPSLTQPDFYVGFSHSEDRVTFPEDNGFGFGLTPNLFLQGNTGFDKEGEIYVADLPNIENTDVDYQENYIVNLPVHGFGAEHNISLYFNNISALLDSPLSTRHEDEKLVFGIGKFFDGFLKFDQRDNGDVNRILNEQWSSNSVFLLGLEGNDILWGSRYSDLLDGGRGDDEIDAWSGDDLIYGGAGNDELDGGPGLRDEAIYQRSFAGNYTITDLGGGQYEVAALTTDEGTDTLVRVEYLTFGNSTKSIAAWLAIQSPDQEPDPEPEPNPTPPNDPPYTPPPDPGLPPEGDPNTLLQVTPVSQSLTFGTSVALSQMFPQAQWVDNDGAYDIVGFAVQDRTIGAGYLTYEGLTLASGVTHDFLLSEFGDIRFVASGQLGIDQVGFNIIQADGDYSPSLPLGAMMASVAPTTTRPPEEPDDPPPDPSEDVAIIDIDNHSDGDEFEEGRSAKFTIERRGSLEGDVELAWRVFGIGNDPADANDFVATAGTITMRDGDDERTLNIALADDSIFEQDERFGIDLDIISGNAEFSDDDERGTILNDDILPPWGSGTDDHGNSLNSATLVSGESWAQGFIEEPGDVDWFRFDLRGDGSYLIKAYGDNDTSLINGDSTNNAPDLEEAEAILYRADGSIIARLTEAGGNIQWGSARDNYELDLQGQPDQTVYLSVRENGDNDVGQYFVQAQVRIEPDDLPANVTTPAVLSPGDIYYGFHERDDDDDWVGVELQAGETYRFAVASSSFPSDSSLTSYPYPQEFFHDRYEPRFQLLNEQGQVVAERNDTVFAHPTILEYQAPTTGSFFLSIAGDDGTGRMREWALIAEQVAQPSVQIPLVVQGSNVTEDLRFDAPLTASSPALDGATLEIDGNTISALKFDLSGLPDVASYAAIEVYVSETSDSQARSADIVIKTSTQDWSGATTLADIGTADFVTAVPEPEIGGWVTIPITALYNQWQSGERPNGGIVLLPSETFVPRLSLHSSDATVDPALKPKLVIQGPGIGAELTGTFTAEMSEDDVSVSGGIGIASAFLPGVSFADAAALGQYGSIAVNAAGDTWTYTPFASVQALDAGDTVQDTLAIAASNGVAQQIAITLSGEDDPSVFVGATTVAVTASAGVGSGGLALFDIDGDDDPVFLARSYEGSRGTLVLEATGDWTYTVDEARLGGLTRGDTVQDTFDVAHSLGSDSLTINLVVDTENNTDPAADAEYFEVAEDGTLTVAVSTLLDGDTDADGDTLTVASVSNAVNGTVILEDKDDGDASNDEVIFTPTPGHSGPATFDYTVADGFGGEATVTVDVTVNAAPNVPPFATSVSLLDDGFPANLVGQFSTIADALAAASDDFRIEVDVSYAAGPETVSTSLDNITLWTPVGNETTVNLTGATPQRFVGTGDGNFIFTGNGSGTNYFNGSTFGGGSGNDTFNVVGGGNDISGNPGIDTVNLGIDLADVTEFTRNGDPVLPNLLVRSSTGDTSLYGVEVINFNDVTFNGIYETTAGLPLATANNDIFVPRPGQSSFMDGLAGRDVLLGHDRSDTLVGGQGDDTLTGGGENDVLDGGPDNDSMTGGAGDDIFVKSADGSNDTITDFEKGTGPTSGDKIDVSAYNLTFDQIEIETELGGLRVRLAGDSILLQEVFTNSLDATDFIGLLQNTPQNEAINLVSVSSNGTQGNDDVGFTASISGDGRYIAFDSFASNLVSEDFNSASDIFLHDRITGNIQKISVSNDGLEGNGSSFGPDMSNDGNIIAFFSVSSNLVENDTNGVFDIFVRNRANATTERISESSNGQEANGGSFDLHLSADGRFLSFSSLASNLVSNDTNELIDTFFHDLNTGVTERVSIQNDGSEFDFGTYPTGISSDGNIIQFSSINGGEHFLYLRLTQEVVSITLNDRLPGSDTSDDGRYTVANILPSVNNGFEFTNTTVFDTETGNEAVVSISNDGGAANGQSGSSSISANGEFILFFSEASNLVPGDTNELRDWFLAPNPVFDGTVAAPEPLPNPTITTVILDDSNSNINIDGTIHRFMDFGGLDTYTLPNFLSANVTIADNNQSIINLSEGTDITSALFLADGVQFTINGNMVTLLGDPSSFNFVFGGIPFDPTAGTTLTFSQTASAFGTIVPADGGNANAATNTGAVNADGSVGESENLVDLSGQTEVLAQEGVSEIFVLEFDSSSGNALSSDAVVSITGFDPAEDILRFDDANGVPQEEASFLNGVNGAVVVLNGFSGQTLVSFRDDDSADTVPPAGVTLVGITDATLGGTTPFFEVM